MGKIKKVKGILSGKKSGEYKLGSISEIIAKSVGKKKPKYDPILFEIFSRKSSPPPPPAEPSSPAAKDVAAVEQKAEHVPKSTTSRKFHQQFDYEKDQAMTSNSKPKTFKQVFSKFSNPTKKLKIPDVKDVKLSNKDAAGIRIDARNKIRSTKSEPEGAEEKSSDQDQDDDEDDGESDIEADGDTEEKVFEEENKKDDAKSKISNRSLRESNAPKPKNEEQENRTIFIGNVPKEMSQNQLLKLFKNYPGIENCRFRCGAPSKPTTMKRIAINKKLIHPDISTIVAYIRFKDRLQAEKAKEEMNGYQLHNDHHLKVDLATTNDKERDDKKAIFVGNLHMKITDNELWQAFEECGKIENVRVIRDRESGCGKGFGYVNFKDSSSVESALNKDTIELRGRPMRVSRIIKKVTPKDKSRVRNRNKSEDDNHNPVTTIKGQGAKIKTKNKKIKVENTPFPRNKKIKFEDNEEEDVKVKPNKKKIKLEELKEKMEMKVKRKKEKKRQKTLTDDGVLADHGKIKKSKKRNKGEVMKVKIAKKLELVSGDKTSKKKIKKSKDKTKSDFS